MRREARSREQRSRIVKALAPGRGHPASSASPRSRCTSATYRQLGPLDEQAHLDYVNRIASRPPARSSATSSAVRPGAQVACRGLETPAGFGDHLDCRHATGPTRSCPRTGTRTRPTQPPLVLRGHRGRSAGSCPATTSTRSGGSARCWLAVGARRALPHAAPARGRHGLRRSSLSLALRAHRRRCSGDGVGGEQRHRGVDVRRVRAAGPWSVLHAATARCAYPQLLIGAAVGAVGGLDQAERAARSWSRSRSRVAPASSGGPAGRSGGCCSARSLVVGALVGDRGVGARRHEPSSTRPLDQIAAVGPLPASRHARPRRAAQAAALQPRLDVLEAYHPARAWRGDWVARRAAPGRRSTCRSGCCCCPLLTRTAEPRSAARSGIAYLARRSLISGPYYVDPVLRRDAHPLRRGRRGSRSG